MEDLKTKINQLLESICDPEIPVLTITDLGIVREVTLSPNSIQITITPTYAGCPAMKLIEQQIIAVIEQETGIKTNVKTILSPAWTTDWLTESGKSKLVAYGIAAPKSKHKIDHLLFLEDREIPCPICKSTRTELISQFSSTACKALYKCLDCLEPFDYFKCH